MGFIKKSHDEYRFQCCFEKREREREVRDRERERERRRRRRGVREKKQGCLH
jgi:hypothetical protein